MARGSPGVPPCTSSFLTIMKPMLFSAMAKKIYAEMEENVQIDRNTPSIYPVRPHNSPKTPFLSI